jgi:hypothetical protein
MRWPVVLLLGVCGFFAFKHFVLERPVRHGPGVVAPQAPLQRELAGAPDVLRKDGFRIVPMATFALTARVLARRTYCCGAEDKLAPVDIAFGWGRMSDEAVLAALDISQGGRFYYYRWSNAPPIPVREIVVSSANMHLIPASAAVEKKLRDARVGQIVVLSGYLVHVDGERGFRWTSSLTRDDSGAGACELVWVEDVAVRDRL